MTSGLLVLVQLVMAAITTAPWPMVPSWPSSATLFRATQFRLGHAEAALAGRRLQRR